MGCRSLILVGSLFDRKKNTILNKLKLYEAERKTCIMTIKVARKLRRESQAKEKDK